MMLTPEQRAEISERAEKATPGPWEAEEMTNYGMPGTGFTQAIHIPTRPGSAGTYGFYYCDDSMFLWEDAQFIAAARADIPALLAHATEADARIAELDAKLRRLTA